MRRIPLSRMRPGMTLAQGVFSYAANSLVSPGMVINEGMIEVLKEAGLPAVIVEDDRLQNIDSQAPIKEENLFAAQRAVRDVYRQARAAQTLDVDRLRRIAYQLVDEMLLLSAEEQLVANQINRTFNEYLHEHQVQVAILAVATGRRRGYRIQQLRELALAALLMDIGEMVIKQGVLDKDERLTSIELDEMKKHCFLGFQLVREYLNVPLPVAAAVLHHSERINGTGYPQGLRGDDIHEYAKILAICDTYDALITDRRYRRRYLPQQALGILQAGARQTYDERFIKDFLQVVAPYPVGSIVELDTGDIACVVSVTRENIARPTIRLLLDRQRYLIEGVMEINLLEAPNIQIVRIQEDNAVPVMWKSLLF